MLPKKYKNKDVPVQAIIDVWRSGDTVPVILNLDTRWPILRSNRFNPRETATGWHPMNKRLGRFQSGACRLGDKKICPCKPKDKEIPAVIMELRLPWTCSIYWNS